MAVEVKILADEENKLVDIVAALAVLAGVDNKSFSSPKKLAKREEKKEEKNATKEEAQDESTSKEETYQQSSGATDENSGNDAVAAGDNSGDSTENKPTYTLVDVRKKLVALSQTGKNKEVTKLLAKYGSKNITGLDPEKYADVMAEADEL